MPLLLRCMQSISIGASYSSETVENGKMFHLAKLIGFERNFPA